MHDGLGFGDVARHSPSRETLSFAVGGSSGALSETHLPYSLEQFEEYEKKEKCGLFGIWGPKESAQIVYQGLFAQQHRGQESAGIVVSDGERLEGHMGMGLVSQVFTPRMLREDLAGKAAIGHVALLHHRLQQVVQCPAVAPQLPPRTGGRRP